MVSFVHCVFFASCFTLSAEALDAFMRRHQKINQRCINSKGIKSEFIAKTCFICKAVFNVLLLHTVGILVFLFSVKVLQRLCKNSSDGSRCWVWKSILACCRTRDPRKTKRKRYASTSEGGLKATDKTAFGGNK